MVLILTRETCAIDEKHRGVLLKARHLANCRPHAVHTHAIGAMPELSMTLMLGTTCTDVHSRSFCRKRPNRREQIARSLLPSCKADKHVEVQARDPFEAFLLDRQQILIKVYQSKSPVPLTDAETISASKCRTLLCHRRRSDWMGMTRLSSDSTSGNVTLKTLVLATGLRQCLREAICWKRCQLGTLAKSQQLGIFRQ